MYISAETTICCRITEEYDLLAFPFELQDLNIKLEIENALKIQPIKSLPRLRVHTPVMTQILGVMALPDFNMNNDIGASYRYEDNTLQMVLVYDRSFMYYLYNSYAIMCGLPTMMLTIWMQPPDARAEIDVTVLLVAVTFKVLMSEQLPPVSYLTFLDWYNLIAVLFIFIGCLLHGFVGYLTSHHGAHHGFLYDDVEQVDKKLLTAFAIGWAAFNGIYALAVQAQLELNDSITEVSLIEGNNYRLMQYGENKLDGTALTWEEAMTREADETSTSVYGRYASQTRVHPGEVFKIIFDLMRGIKRKDALGITKSASRAPGALLGHEA